MPTTTTSAASSSSSTASASGNNSNRQADVFSRLASSDPEVKLKALREVKNQIIGNRTKKLSFLKLGAVPAIASALADADDSEKCNNILVQSAAALGSFACGFEAGVQAVLDAGVFPRLLRLLTNPDEKVVDAGARSLRMIFQSNQAPKYDFLQEKNMEFLFSLLNSENENVSGLGASIIAHACGTSVEQRVLCEAGVLEKLVILLDGSLSQREACLESLATVLKNNPEAVSDFVGLESGRYLNSVTELTKDRYPRTRLLSCLCLVVIYNTSPSYFVNMGTKSGLITTLLELLNDPGQSGDDAALGLSCLIAGKEDLQKLAYEANAIKNIVDILKTDSELQTKRLQGLFLSLAELCSKLEDCRCSFVSLQVLDLLINALRHKDADVKAAACICLRNASRSVKNLSAGRFNSDHVMLPLVQLLHDPSSSVQVAVLGALSNIVLDFSSPKSSFIEFGGIKQLIELSKSMDPNARCSALRALRNLMFLADNKRKELYISDVNAQGFACLISDPEPPVQEQALALLRNLVDGCISSIEFVFDEDGLILDTVGRQLRKGPQAHMAIQGMYVLTNVASGTELHKEAVMQQLFPQATGSENFMLKFLQSDESQLRSATVWTIINLISPSSPGAYDRHVKLRSAGIIPQLKNMVNDACLDVKIRIKTVLGQSMSFGDNY
ncbi:PREDICTED: armadillo repeat-containing protein 8 isoform X2 [Camelina sativa]|uniref:Armadillo repeat-containing protein 8 isoform X2 n=1 Tax=Camelina sativa TaxID=90675 RepID=A0ABM1QX16_CAMSA|nr:PREDICTED: armadillo repeat-containing protein 8 isoform X2 [Camelina sativa]